MNEDRIIIEIEDDNGDTLELTEIAQLEIVDPETDEPEDLILFSHEDDPELYLFRIIDEETLEPVKEQALIDAALSALSDE